MASEDSIWNRKQSGLTDEMVESFEFGARIRDHIKLIHEAASMYRIVSHFCLVDVSLIYINCELPRSSPVAPGELRSIESYYSTRQRPEDVVD
jgi:hypothetical protein